MDDLDTELTPRDVRLIERALRKAFRQGRESVLSPLRGLALLNGDGITFLKAFEEAAHPRDHGKFAPKGGGNGANGASDSLSGGGAADSSGSSGGAVASPAGEAGPSEAHLLEGLHEHVPASSWHAVKAKVVKAAQRVHERMVLATPAFLKLQDILTTIGDHPDDLKVIGYTPITSGVAGHQTPDALREATGVPGTIGAKLAAHVLARVLHWMRKGLSADEAVRKALGEVRHIRKTAAHAPKGGVSVQGKDYKGGEFIPAEVMEQATPEEKAKVEGKGEGDSAGHDHAADYKANGTKAKAFKSWFGDWENDPQNASKVVKPETGEPQETHPIHGDASQVRGKDGKPVVVYHGTTAGDFEAFDPAKVNAASTYGPGFYFSTEPEVAQLYWQKTPKAAPAPEKPQVKMQPNGLPEGMEVRPATEEDSDDPYELFVPWQTEPFLSGSSPEKIVNTLNVKGMMPQLAERLRDHLAKNQPAPQKAAPAADGPRAMKAVYLNIRKPFDIDAPVPLAEAKRIYEAMGDSEGADRIQQRIDFHSQYTPNDPLPTERTFVAAFGGGLMGSPEQKKKLRAALEKLGYDGMTHLGSNLGRNRQDRVWMAFHPHQIKSVDNEGTFDPEDHRIHKARG